MGTQCSAHAVLGVASLCTGKVHKLFSHTEDTDRCIAELGKLLLLSAPQMIVCLAAGTGFMDSSKPWRSHGISQMDEGVSWSQLDIQLHFSPLDLRGPFEWIPSPHKQDSCYVSERLVSCIQELNINIYIFSSALEN